MSELYLTLRSRLEAVKAWITIGSETMIRAREERGLSREALGRLMNVTQKTIERWEKEKEGVPRHDVSRYARAVGLEITEPERETIALPSGAGDGRDEISRTMVETQELILEELRALRTERAPDPSNNTRKEQR